MNELMQIHIVAVAGTGMGALSGLLAELGHQVSGSDVAFDPPMGPALESWGVRCMPGFDPKHLEPAPDLVVIGNVCRKDNPEVVAPFNVVCVTRTSRVPWRSSLSTAVRPWS